MTVQKPRRKEDDVEVLGYRIKRPDYDRFVRQADVRTSSEESSWVMFKTLRRVAKKSHREIANVWPALRSEISKVNERSKQRQQIEHLAGEDLAYAAEYTTPEELVATKQAFEQLQAEDRKLVELMHQGYDAKEIAQQYGVEPSAMRQRICRLRAKLKGFDILLGTAVALVAAAGGVVGFADEPTSPVFVSAIVCILVGVAILPSVLVLRAMFWKYEATFRQRFHELMANEAFALLFPVLSGLGIASACLGLLVELEVLVRVPAVFLLLWGIPFSIVQQIGEENVRKRDIEGLNESLCNIQCSYAVITEAIGHSMRGTPKTRAKRNWTIQTTSDLPHQILEAIRDQLESKLRIAVVCADGCISWTTSVNHDAFLATTRAIRDVIGADKAAMYRNQTAALLH